MKLLDELKGIEILEDPIDIISRDKLPIVLWGAGEFAGEILSYLNKRKLKISEVVVDDEYYSAGSFLSGFSVVPRSELVKKYSMVNVIWANSSYEKISLLTGAKGINKVFYLFSVNYGVHDKTTLSYVRDHIESFETAYAAFEDETSRKNYLAFLKTRISGDNSYILQEFHSEGNFFNNDIFQINSNEVLLDVGAYDGDTIRVFLRENNRKYRYIYALEPDAKNFSKLKAYIHKEKLENITVMDIGAWNKTASLDFTATNEQISGIAVGNDCKLRSTSIPVRPLDEVFGEQEQITMLKINYFEGVYEALEGSAMILKHHMPKLAITVGFDCTNIRRIPQLIKKLNPKYRLYLRFNRAMVSACTLYGI